MKTVNKFICYSIMGDAHKFIHTFANIFVLNSVDVNLNSIWISGWGLIRNSIYNSVQNSVIEFADNLKRSN